MNCLIPNLLGELGLGGLEHRLLSLIGAMDRRQYQPVVALWGNSPNDRFVPEIRVLDVFVSALGAESR